MRFASRPLIGWVALIVVVAALSAVLPVYWIYLLSTVAVTALVARSVGLVTNQTGMLTLCQMSFAAIGGWVVSWMSLTWPSLPFPLLVLSAGLVTLPIGLLLGLATMRIRGVELAVVTLGFAAALDIVIGRASFPGAGQGIAVIPSAPFGDPRWFLALAWGLLLVLQILLNLVGRTPLGLSWTSVRVSERATAALGVRVGPAKTTSFAFGALLAGVAGGMLAGQYGLLTGAVFSPVQSMVIFASAILAGASVLGGAILAGALAVFVPELLRQLNIPLDVGNVLFAFGAFDVLRRGTGGIAEGFVASAQERRFRSARTNCSLPPLAEVVRGAPADTSRHALKVTDLSVAFGGNRVLHDVKLDVLTGEVHALIGPNGAGKSTFVDATTGFLAQYTGRIELDGSPIDSLSARERARRGLRRTFQQSRVIDDLTIGDYLKLAGGSSVDAEHVANIADYLGLPESHIPIRLMDIGSRRVLEIAGALVSSPTVLLLDEPASGLSEEESLALAQRIGQIPARFGCAVLLIEHDMTFVRTAAHRITVLDYGEQICAGPVDEVLSDPRVVAAYLGKEVTA